jgi:Protein of unknown function (DUF3631)
VTGGLKSLDVVIDGAALLDEVHAMLTRYIVFPCPEAADAAALYAATTHAQHELQFAARLNVRSPHKRCGKTRLLDLLELLVHNPLITVDISAAALVRSITEENPPTIMLDEADVTFGKNVKGDEKAEHLRGIFNAGFERGRPYTRWDITTRKPEKCPTFSMAIIAGIGRLPDTIEDRSIIITLRRKAPHEKAEKFRRRHKADVQDLGKRLAAWIRPHAKRLGDAEPVMPDGLNDRAEDTWEALIAVASLAGGSWPDRAATAAKKLSAEAAENDGDSWQMRLLADLRGIFGDADALHGTAILTELHKLEESPWADYYGKPLTARGLADLLRPYNIRSKDVKIDGTTLKGYRRSDLWDTWQRYPSATSATSQVRQVADENPGTLPPLPGSGGSGWPIASATTLSSQVAEVAEVADTPQDSGACPRHADTGFGAHPRCRDCQGAGQ